MTSYDSCTSGTSRVLTVASLQWLKIEALIPAPVDCEVRFMIKFLNAQSIAPIKIHRQLYLAYGHTRLVVHISCSSSAGRYLIMIHPTARTSCPMISIFLTPQEIPLRSAPAFSEWQRDGDGCHSGFNPRQQTSTTQDTKVGPTVWQIHLQKWDICWKIAEHLLFGLQ